MLWAHHAFPHFQFLGMAGYVVVFWVSFFESLIFTGMFVPGTVIVVIAGSFAARGFYSFWLIVIASTLAAMLGDAISYELGLLGEAQLERMRISQKKLAHAQHLFLKYQRISILLGRFIGPTRPIIPFVAGLAEMKRPVYYQMNIISGFLWSLFYTGLGFFFGRAWKMALLWTSKGLILVLLLVILWFAVKWAVTRKKAGVVQAG